MLGHVLPYTCSDTEWWTGLVITNSLSVEHPVLLDRFTSNGVPLETREIVLAPYSQWVDAIGMPTGIPRGWMRVHSGQGVVCATLMGENQKMVILPDGTSIPLPKSTFSIPETVTQSTVGLVCSANPIPMRVINQPYVKLPASCINQYAIPAYWDFIRLFGLQMRLKYPGRQDYKTWIADASTNDETEAPGHPGASHSAGRGMDFNYFTNTLNFTQGPATDGIKPISIWADDGITLLPSFDAYRTMELIVALRNFSSTALIIADSHMRVALQAAAQKMYGQAGFAWFSPSVLPDGRAWVQYDESHDFHHNTHLHCDLLGNADKYQVNWSLSL